MTFKIDDDVLRKVETLAAQGLSEEQIGSVIGCSRETIRRRKNDNAAFEAAIKNGKAKGIATVTNALFQKAKNGDNTAMIFFLKNRDRANWGENEQEQQSGKSITLNFNQVGNAD
jgi:transcriptional regulator with XRE-family HTH domain